MPVVPRKAACMARYLRKVFGEQYQADLSGYSDSEIVDTIEYHLFPNMILFPGFSLPMVYRFLPDRHDHRKSTMEVLFLRPKPTDGRRFETATSPIRTTRASVMAPSPAATAER